MSSFPCQMTVWRILSSVKATRSFRPNPGMGFPLASWSSTLSKQVSDEAEEIAVLVEGARFIRLDNR